MAGNANRSFGQAVGDYGSAAVGPANWGTAGSWVVCVSAGTWAGATVATVVPNNLTSVWIRAGHTITMNGNPGACNNLTINGIANWTGVVTTNVSGNLIISGGTLSGSNTGTLNVAGTLTVPAGTSASIQRSTITVTGNINIAGNVNFEINSSGTKTLIGLVTIQAGGVWNNSINEAITFRGGITNNGAFTAGTGVHTFTTNAQSISGSISIPNVTVTGITLTSNGNLTVGTALAGTGGITQAANSTLNIGGTSAITTLTATADGNTVNYNGAAQTAKVTNYSNLTVSNSGIKTFATTPTVNGVLSLEGTASVVVTTGAVAYGAVATLQYNKPAAYTATLEEWPATFSGTGGVRIINTGVISFAATKAITNNLSIATGARVNLGTFTTHTVGSLTLGSFGAINGPWGSTSSAATYNDDVFFAATSGILTVNVSTCIVPSAPATSGAPVCIGTSAILSASGAVSGEKYKWYDASTGGALLKTSANNTDNTFTTPVLAVTANYWVSVINPGSCESARTMVTATFPIVSPDNQNLAGTNSWVGHVYDGTNFNTYFGTYTETELFDQSFGGDVNCFSINSSVGSRTIYTETFSVKYRMNSTKKGFYVVDLGSDDGSRLTVDGTLLFNNWADQAFTSRPRVLLSLNGASSLVYDFNENGGQNRVVFQNLTLVLANNLTSNTTQNICIGNTGTSITGDVFGVLPTGISLSGSGYQWTYSTTPGGTRTNISGATGAAFTPNTASAPFNVAGTYYVYRNAILSSTNNVVPNPYVATNESSAAIITVRQVFSAGAILTAGETICSGGDPEVVGNSVAASGGDENITYEWRANGTPITSANSSTYDPPSGLTASTTFTRWAKDNTCNTALTQSTGSWIVNVNPLPATGEIIPD